MSKVYVTKQGYQKMLEDVNHLINVENKEALEMLKEAREKGDISENAEYEAAKELLDNLSVKIANLQKKVKSCEIISSDGSCDKVNMLSTVQVKNLATQKILTWTLVPENEIDIKSGRISFNSPIGSALLSKKRGDVVEVQVPAGLMKLEIVEIEFDYKF
jgi:transcription elongation factor GreA